MLQVVSTGSEEALPGASAFATLDREGVIVGRGERFELLAKWLTQRECRVGMSLEHWLPARSAKAWRSLLARAFEGVGTSQRELVECGPNGLREVELSFEPPSATGTELVLMVLRDCSGERRLTQGCLRARAELAAMLEASAGPAWIVDQRLELVARNDRLSTELAAVFIARSAAPGADPLCAAYARVLDGELTELELDTQPGLHGRARVRLAPVLGAMGVVGVAGSADLLAAIR